MKNVSGYFNRWITRFEDQIETCETIGIELFEEAKILYFMNNLNDSIFGDVKANFVDLSTRALFPQTYEDIKQRMIAKRSSKSSEATISGATARQALKLNRMNAIYVESLVISIGHASSSTRNTPSNRIIVTIRRSTGSSLLMTEKPLKVSQHVAELPQVLEELTGREQHRTTTRGPTTI